MHGRRKPAHTASSPAGRARRTVPPHRTRAEQPAEYFPPCDRLADPEGLEPPTPWFEAKCSIQLSYGSVRKIR